MSRPLQPPGYRHLGGNVFVATADTPLVRTTPGRLRPPPPPPPDESAQAVVSAFCAARASALKPRADSCGLAQADMRRQLTASGIKPAA